MSLLFFVLCVRVCFLFFESVFVGNSNLNFGFCLHAQARKRVCLRKRECASKGNASFTGRLRRELEVRPQSTEVECPDGVEQVLKRREVLLELRSRTECTQYRNGRIGVVAVGEGVQKSTMDNREGEEELIVRVEAVLAGAFKRCDALAYGDRCLGVESRRFGRWRHVAEHGWDFGVVGRK